MPLQNRVDPWGRLHAVTARGTLTGNRGIIHNQAKGNRCPVANEGVDYLSLSLERVVASGYGSQQLDRAFFLDEATAFAAGHRPCATCRRERFIEFKEDWLAAQPTMTSAVLPRVTEIDAILHTERVNKRGEKVTYEDEFATLVDGTMIEMDSDAYLIWRQQLLKWSFDGYVPGKIRRLSMQRVRVLTPISIVRMFRYGFRPEVHTSAQSV